MKYLILILLLFPILGFASNITIVNGGSGKAPVHAITIKASHVVIDITIGTDDEEGLINEWSAMDEFKKYLEALAQTKNSIEIERVASTYSRREKSNLFGSYNPRNNYRLRVITPLSKSENVIQGMKRLNNFIESIKSPKNIEFRVGAYALGIQNKESYKSEILARVKSEVESIAQGLGSNYAPNLRDFSKEVIVEQNGEETVALYYSYSIDYEQ